MTSERVKSETVWAIHPRTGDKIVNVHDNCIGIRADLVRPGGERIRLSGTWVFAPDLSFSVLDDASACKAGISPGYVMIGGAWQY